MYPISVNPLCLFKALHALENFDVDPSPIVLEIVLGNDFIWNDGERERHVFKPYHRSKLINVLRSKVVKQTPGVDMVLLKRILIVVMLAVLVEVGPE